MTKRKLRVAVLLHEHLSPPETLEGLSEREANDIKQEFDVCRTLERLGHDVVQVPVVDELKPIRAALEEHRPHVAFNLLMHFHDAGIYDSAVVAWLELRKQRYTGCNPRGLLVANDKALCKKVLHYHRIRAPKFFVVPRGKAPKKLPKGLRWPLFVKSRSEHSSTGISQASIVHDPEQLSARPLRARDGRHGRPVRGVHRGPRADRRRPGNKRVEISPVGAFMDDLPAGVANIATSR